MLSTLLSGLTAFVLSDKQYPTLGLSVVGRARVLLRGKACKKTEEQGLTRHRSLTKPPVLKRLKITSPNTELLVLRSRWYQSVCADPANHEHYLSAMFSPMSEDDTSQQHTVRDLLSFAVTNVSFLSSRGPASC